MKPGSIIYYRTKSSSDKKKSSKKTKILKPKKSKLLGKIAYLRYTENKGWMPVWFIGTGSKTKKMINGKVYSLWEIPDFTILKIYSEDENYFYCKRIEGIKRREYPTMAINRKKYEKYLSTSPQSYYTNVKLTFTIEKDLGYDFVQGTLHFNNKKYTAISLNLPDGTYSVRIPYHAHQKGSHYGIHATTWFRIDKPGVGGDRFLHPGIATDGCCTVNETNRWEEIYKILIRSRRNRNDVATLKVLDIRKKKED